MCSPRSLPLHVPVVMLGVCATLSIDTLHSPRLPADRAQRAEVAEDHLDGKPSLQHHPEPSLQRRGRASDGSAGVDKDGVQQQQAFKRLQWPSYRDDGKSYTIVGSSIRQTASSSAHDSERRWGWVKKGLEGYGTGGVYGTSERPSPRRGAQFGATIFASGWGRKRDERD